MATVGAVEVTVNAQVIAVVLSRITTETETYWYRVHFSLVTKSANSDKWDVEIGFKPLKQNEGCHLHCNFSSADAEVVPVLISRPFEEHCSMF